MNCLLQDSTLLLGSRNDIELLAEKDSAKVLVVSDSHGNWHNLYLILKENGMNCDALVFCGDGICDLTNVLGQSLTDKDIRNCIPPVIAFVQGNNDTDMYPIVNPEYKEGSNTNYYNQIKVPPVQNIRVAGHDIFISHGHKYSLYNGTDLLTVIANNSSSDTVFYGHTHVAASEIKEKGILVLNPGSCSIPRMSQPKTFAVVNFIKGKPVEDFVFFQINGTKTKPYIPDGRMLFW